ncbi:MAG: thioredoxin fold domain-containing protein [Cytophagales bacterium]|nr:thioredoxin fold domain-containing protein [Cytophagales bacterium]
MKRKFKLGVGTILVLAVGFIISWKGGSCFSGAECSSGSEISAGKVVRAAQFLGGGSVAVLPQAEIKWLSIQEVESNMAREKRKVFVDVYTDWCGWCKKMDRTTFLDEDIIDYLRVNYYSVKFNAESKEEISFANKTFKFVSGGGSKGYNQLAAALTQGQLSYPSFAILDENLKLIKVIRGYHDAKQLKKVLVSQLEK